MINELSFSSNSTFPSHCVICPLAKQRRIAFPSFNHMAAALFDLIHCDVWGPFHTYSTEGFCYFLTIIDDNTRFTWVYFLKSKFDVNTIMP